MNDYFMISETDGSLYDTRADGWHTLPPLRKNYRLHHSRISSFADVKACLRAGAYTFPGCYPLYFVCRDGSALSFESACKNIDSICANDSDWHIVACQVNWEDSDLRCEHSGELIQSAYGE